MATYAHHSFLSLPRILSAGWLWWAGGLAIVPQLFILQPLLAATPGRELQFTAPVTALGSPGGAPQTIPQTMPQTIAQNAANYYLVYVTGNSDQLLGQVKRVAPQAFRKQLEGQSVIQTGLFANRYRAEELVQTLQAQNLPAQLAVVSGNGISPVAASSGASTMTAPTTATSYSTIPNTATSYSTTPAYGTTGYATTATTPTYGTPASPPTIGSSSSNSQVATTSTGDQNVLQGYANAYFVIIPSRGRDLQSIADQVQRLGAPANSVIPRSEPNGPHVAVGPFATRGLAERWSSFFNTSGLDARVYFGK